MCLSAWVSYGRSYQQCLQSIRLSNKTETSITLCGKVQPPPASYGSDLKGWAIWTKVFLSQILEEGKVHPRQKFYSPNFSPGPPTNFAPKKNAVSFLNKMFGLRGSLCAPNAPHCRQAAIFGAEPGWLRGPGPYLDADITGMATRQPLGGSVGANLSLLDEQDFLKMGMWYYLIESSNPCPCEFLVRMKWTPQ